MGFLERDDHIARTAPSVKLHVAALYQDSGAARVGDGAGHKTDLDQFGQLVAGKLCGPRLLRGSSPVDHNRRAVQMDFAALVVGGVVHLRGDPDHPVCPHVGRLFPNYAAVEEAYYKRTKIFPIMHMIGIRRSLVEKHPWLPVSVYKAFARAKEIAIEELGLIGHLAVTLPWPVAAQDEARRVLGEDYWSYGNTESNSHVLKTFVRYSHEQGLIAKPMAWEELFAPSTLELSKI